MIYFVVLSPDQIVEVLIGQKEGGEGSGASGCQYQEHWNAMGRKMLTNWFKQLHVHVTLYDRMTMTL